MIEKKKEIKTFETVYVSTDGTEFLDKDECIKYENSAKGVLLGKYSPIVIKSDIEDNLFGLGSGDYEIDIVKIPTKEALDVIEQLVYLYNSYLLNNDYTGDSKDRVSEVCLRAFEKNDYLYIGRGYPGDEQFWPLYTKQDFLDRINNSCVKK